MDKPLVSVIIPVYNVSAYLPKCLDSVTAQTYRNLEIILVDDGSTDGSGEICEEYAERDGRIIVIHKENGGPSDTRNAGIERMTGSYVAFVDSDDCIDVKFIEILLMTALKYHVQLVIGAYKKFMDEFQVIETKNTVFDSQPVHQYSAREAMLNMLYRRELPMYSHGKLYDKNLFQTVRFPKGRLYEDVAVTWETVKQVDRLIYIDTPLYYYRQRKGSIVNASFYTGKMDQAYMAKNIMDEVADDAERYQAAVSKYFFCLADLYAQIDSKHGEERRFLKSELKKYARTVQKNKENDKAIRLLAAVGKINIYFIRVLGKGYKHYNRFRWKKIRKSAL